MPWCSSTRGIRTFPVGSSSLSMRTVGGSGSGVPGHTVIRNRVTSALTIGDTVISTTVSVHWSRNEATPKRRESSPPNGTNH